MSDIRENVARILCPRLYPYDQYDEAVDIVQIEAMQLAGSCIAAATPHIRAALFDELIAYCENKSNEVKGHEGRKFWVGSKFWIEDYAKNEQDQP